MNQVLHTWGSKRLPFVPDGALPSDEEFAIYIASHYRNRISNETIWSSTLARSFLNAKARAFAEQSIAAYPEGQVPEQPEVDETLDAVAKNVFIKDLPSTPKLLVFLSFSTLVIYVGRPALLAALLFRGGLILLATGVTFVRRDGREASRFRLFWRALVIWGPLIGIGILGISAVDMHAYGSPLVGAVTIIALAVWSLLLPVRGLPDRLAGTWPVPR